MSSLDDLTAAIKSLAREAGFARVGIAPAGRISQSEGLREWLERGFQAGMKYMQRDLDVRLDPRLLVEGARSVICLAVGYAPSPGQVALRTSPGRADAGRVVAGYARGRDYHKVLKRRSSRLMERIRGIEPGFVGKAFVDSAPVMERTLAAQAGVGWIGRNGCLVAPGLGSYVLLCEIVCNLPLTPDTPLRSRCHDCGECQSACPTGALKGDGLVDARRCVSYLTIEHRGRIDPELWPLMGTMVFGCDACQEACPHNRDLPPGDAELTLSRGAACRLWDILCWSRGMWDERTRGLALRRAKHEMWLRNAAIAAGNTQPVGPEAEADRARLIAALCRLAEAGPESGETVTWALARLSPASARRK